jgi:hypothetical protein
MIIILTIGRVANALSVLALWNATHDWGQKACEARRHAWWGVSISGQLVSAFRDKNAGWFAGQTLDSYEPMRTRMSSSDRLHLWDVSYAQKSGVAMRSSSLELFLTLTENIMKLTILYDTVIYRWKKNWFRRAGDPFLKSLTYSTCCGRASSIDWC